MVFSYPKEYFFPIIIKECEEIGILGDLLDESGLTRGYEEKSLNKVFDELDEEFAKDLIKDRN
jgi:hypothetical protein